MFERGINDPRIDFNSKFDETTQDLLAISYLNETIETYSNGGEASIIEGLGRRWLGLKKLDQKMVKEALDYITQEPSFQGPFGQINYQPGALVRFYKAGNIGPTSTGQHTDIKQLDNPRTPANEFRREFKYTDLDDYVVVQDRELGQVPIGSVPETGDFESHSERITRT